MSYEERPDGTHAMQCDSVTCDNECLSPSKGALLEDLSLGGWVAEPHSSGGVPSGGVSFICPSCRSEHPAKRLIDLATGGTGIVHTDAPMTVKKGDEHYNLDGELVGHYTEDAQQGDRVGIKVEFPEPPVAPDRMDVYDAMLHGSDADDDKHRTAPRVDPAPAKAPGASTASTQTSAQVPGATPAERARVKVDSEALSRASSLFQNFDTDWDPDD